MKLGEITRLLGGELAGDAETEITGVAGIEHARQGDITFVLGRKLAAEAGKSAASCILVKEHYPEIAAAQLRVDDPQLAFAVLLGMFHKRPAEPAGVSPLSYVAGDVSLGEGVTVSPFACVMGGASVGHGSVVGAGVYVGHGVKVGEDCVLHPNVVLMDGTAVGDRVIIHAGTVVGSDGFGYLQRGGKNVKVPQVGGVVIEDDVEIGACVAIDRATTGNTVIGRGTKIDNLVQVAHNVTIGEHSVVVAQVGIAGSSRIGRGCMIGGQAALSDHTTLDDGTMLAARAGAMGHLSKGAYGGTPAFPHREWLKSSSLFMKLPELQKRIAALEAKLRDIEGRQGDD